MSESTVATTVFKARISPKWLRLKKPNNHGQSDERQLYLTVLKHFAHLIQRAPKQRLELPHFHPLKRCK